MIESGHRHLMQARLKKVGAGGAHRRMPTLSVLTEEVEARGWLTDLKSTEMLCCAVFLHLLQLTVVGIFDKLKEVSTEKVSLYRSRLTRDVEFF